ncbi:selenide, water dikinase SelD [Psychromonas sp. CD1]|uniref:selenide, water dikinase SelD n=1 Tax=Psychromonas sp. CD1 TaxID=1979839 RepID=UPI000B9B6928|nr:selenide, water dikinase SelD [Psychromonas sp. CD1]
MNKIRLTQYSHGAGCGCKISPKVLGEILKTNLPQFSDPNLLVGNEDRDDAAVYDLQNGTSIVSTTDFFMPIVDDPYDFGRIAATNAISDVYAMGGKPIMAIAILGWPLDKLSPNVAQKVIEGGRKVCQDAGIVLAGGHSIDAPEPIFGLAVTGTVNTDMIKRNSQATSSCELFITKPLGIGILTTAEKFSKLKPEHQGLAIDWMCKLNKSGVDFAQLDCVKAMTDVTGFGLLGHLSEVCIGSGLVAHIVFDNVPTLPGVFDYIAEGCVPGGTARNYASYEHLIGDISELQKSVLCDPQTSGGLLLAVEKGNRDALQRVAVQHGIMLVSIGEMHQKHECSSIVVYVD